MDVLILNAVVAGSSVDEDGGHVWALAHSSAVSMEDYRHGVRIGVVRSGQKSEGNKLACPEAAKGLNE